jgi:hypothetical protein
MVVHVISSALDSTSHSTLSLMIPPPHVRSRSYTPGVPDSPTKAILRVTAESLRIGVLSFLPENPILVFGKSNPLLGELLGFVFGFELVMGDSLPSS